MLQLLSRSSITANFLQNSSIIVDRNLRAAMMFIDNSPEISADCKQYSHAVACYHMYKVCDRSAASSPRANPNHARILSICRKDCEALQV